MHTDASSVCGCNCCKIQDTDQNTNEEGRQNDLHMTDFYMRHIIQCIYFI